MVCLIIWSAVAKIDEVTRGQGKVIPSRQVQVIQSQDGGVVTEILVREGDFVEKEPAACASRPDTVTVQLSREPCRVSGPFSQSRTAASAG